MTIKPGDYVKTISKRFKQERRGRVRRTSWTMCLIEWSYAGGKPPNMHTWVDISEIKRTYRKHKI